LQTFLLLIISGYYKILGYPVLLFAWKTINFIINSTLSHYIVIASFLTPIPLPTSPLKGEELYNSLPFKGRARVGMG